MAGLFGVLDTASRGLTVAQQGIQTTSNNISNVNTPGYSRQRQRVEASLPVLNPNGNIGTGAEQKSVDRIVDSFIQTQIVKQNASAGSTDVQAGALGRIEETFNEQQGVGIGGTLSKLYDAFSELAAAPQPGAPVQREGLRAAAQTTLDILHSADAQIRSLRSSAQQSIDSIIPEINALTTRIADLNREITKVAGTSTPNELFDQRDQAIRELSQKIEINTFKDGNSEVVVLPSGMPLVEGVNSNDLIAVADPSNPFDAPATRIGFPNGSSTVDVTNDIGGGELGGLLRVRDSILPSAIRSLDTIAYNLVASVNAVHSGGVGLDGTVGNFFNTLPGVEDAARDIALDANILGSPDAIAAGLSAAPADNRNAAALAAMRDVSSAIFVPGDPPGPATGPARSLLTLTANIVADIGQQTATMQNTQTQDARVSEILENRRDEVSGVSLDEEVTHLVQLQAAFQANARVMQTVDRLLETLLSVI